MLTSPVKHEHLKSFTHHGIDEAPRWKNSWNSPPGDCKQPKITPDSKREEIKTAEEKYIQQDHTPKVFDPKKTTEPHV